MFLHPDLVLPHFNISEGMKVADIGSGHGHFAVPVARKVGPSGRVYAIDVVSDALDQLRSEALGEGLPHIHFIHSNIEKERGSFLASQSIDRALLINTLFMIDDKKAAIEEILRILNPNGSLVLIDWRDSYKGIGPHKNNVISEGQAIRLAESLGFVVKKEFNAGDLHYGIIFH